MQKQTLACSSNESEMLLKNTQLTLDSISKNIDAAGRKGAFARGQMFELVGYFDKAVHAYTEALSDQPNCIESSCRLALAQIKAGHHQDALVTASKIAGQQGTFKVKALATSEVIPALTILGDALAVNQRFGDALVAYETAQKESGDEYTSGRLAQMYLAAGEPDKAVQLRNSLGDNIRFSDLKSVLALGDTNIALLPRFGGAELAAQIAKNVHGRPMLVNGKVLTAEALSEDTGWYADVD
jgi:tetratricopeptide (TPR) repeat protein